MVLPVQQVFWWKICFSQELVIKSRIVYYEDCELKFSNVIWTLNNVHVKNYWHKKKSYNTFLKQMFSSIFHRLLLFCNRCLMFRLEDLRCSNIEIVFVICSHCRKFGSNIYPFYIFYAFVSIIMHNTENFKFLKKFNRHSLN